MEILYCVYCTYIFEVPQNCTVSKCYLPPLNLTKCIGLTESISFFTDIATIFVCAI